MRWHGWMVRELSQPRAVARDLIGMPDVIAFKAQEPELAAKYSKPVTTRTLLLKGEKV